MNREIILSTLLWVTATAISLAASVPTNLKSTPIVNPIGLPLNEYALSWKTSNGQTAYRILVASDLQKLSAEIGNLWDSGRRDSPKSSMVPCIGYSFKNGSKVWWKVQVWNHDGIKSEFSEPSLIQVPNSQKKKRNRVIFLGDSLISRMEDFGYFETAATARWPHHDITFRNLGWPGDDVFGTARAEFKDSRNTRSWKPGPSNGVGYQILLQQVRDSKASTIIVGYGSEVAFAKSGLSLDKFKAGYTKLIKDIKGNDASLILLTPPAQEATGSPLPDLVERNERLAEAANFIIKYAQENNHPVIDLFGKLITQKSETLTENGLHLNDKGYRKLAALMSSSMGISDDIGSLITINPEGNVSSQYGAIVKNPITTKRGIRFDMRPDIIFSDFLSNTHKVLITDASKSYQLKTNGVEVLSGNATGWRSGYSVAHGPNLKDAENLRSAIISKNLQHRRRFRPLNKTYIFLFRSYEMGHLRYEMEDFDRLVAAEEETIARLRVPQTHRFSIESIDPWKPVHDDPEHEVPRHIPEPDVNAELASMTVPEGFELNLFASDPILTNPINLNWDTRGRAWVSMSSTYPHIKPGKEPNDRIVILEDTDQDGVADKSITFADGLLVPHSVIPVKGGAYVCSATEFLFLSDTDGDDRADQKRVIFSGFGNADVHHMIHSLRWAPWGELYFNQSIYINSFIETRWGKRRLNGSGVWRFRPETERLEIFARGAVNPWGHAIDRWGQSFITDGAGGQGPHYTFPGAAFRSAVGAPKTLSGLVPGKPNGTGCEVLSGRHFPEEWAGSIVENDFRANRTVRYKISDDGSGFAAKEVETLIHSSRQTYRPVDLKVGPDGALYVVDWYNAIIDHGEVDFHHPLRDKAHGRIWRLRAKDRQLVELPHISGAPVEALLDHLKAPEDYTRTQAKRELATRSQKEVLPKLKSWLINLPADDSNREHHLLEALWLRGTMNAPDEELLREVLKSTEARARANAVRILFHWRNHITNPYELFRTAIDDAHPRVRLEAVNVLREMGSLESANIALGALRQSLDKWLEYAIWLTSRELRDDWLPALEAGEPVFGGDTDQLRYALEATGDSRATESLVTLLQNGNINATNLTNVVKTVAGLGGVEEIDMVLSLVQKKPNLLIPIVAGARNNKAIPRGIKKILPLLEHQDSNISRAAAELTGIWDVKGAGESLERLVRNSENIEERFTAARALGRLKDFDRLANLAKSDQSQKTRIAATAIWAENQSDKARESVIEILTKASTIQEIEPLFLSFINRKSGDKQLQEALQNTSIKKNIAIEGIRLIRSSGREFPELVSAMNKAGNLKLVPLDLSQKDRKKLLSEVAISGNPGRGKEVYHRKAMACTICHQIGTNGGLVGPELSSIGAYAQPAAILDSILSPSRDIKQGYETVLVTKQNDTIVAGIFQRRSDTATLIRETTNKIIPILNSDVKKIEKSPVSLMPPGLTLSLRSDELVDLISFLVSLNGKN